MSTAQTPHSIRIEAAHDRLLAALRIPAEADGPTARTLVSRRVDDLGGALASLIGSLIAEAERTDLITPARIAQAVERTLGRYTQDATERTEALLEAQAEAAVMHALPPIDYPGRTAGVEPGPRCGKPGRTALLAADVTCPKCLALMAGDGGAR